MPPPPSVCKSSYPLTVSRVSLSLNRSLPPSPATPQEPAFKIKQTFLFLNLTSLLAFGHKPSGPRVQWQVRNLSTSMRCIWKMRASWFAGLCLIEQIYLIACMLLATECLLAPLLMSSHFTLLSQESWAELILTLVLWNDPGLVDSSLASLQLENGLKTLLSLKPSWSGPTRGGPGLLPGWTAPSPILGVAPKRMHLTRNHLTPPRRPARTDGYREDGRDRGGKWLGPRTACQALDPFMLKAGSSQISKILSISIWNTNFSLIRGHMSTCIGTHTACKRPCVEWTKELFFPAERIIQKDPGAGKSLANCINERSIAWWRVTSWCEWHWERQTRGLEMGFYFTNKEENMRWLYSGEWQPFGCSNTLERNQARNIVSS